MFKKQIINSVVGLLSGLLFAAGMVISEMVDPVKVIGFLNVTGQWDPSLAFVMAGALLVFTPLYHLFIKPRQLSINGEPFVVPTAKKVDGPLISGAIIFGIGWGLAGFCPGPAVSSIGAGSPIILIFITTMLMGMIVAHYYLTGHFDLAKIGRYAYNTGQTRSGLKK